MQPESLILCTVCGAGVLDGSLHREWHSAQAGGAADADEARRNGQVIDEFLASVDTEAIDRAILDGTVDEPYNAERVVGHLRELLRSG